MMTDYGLIQLLLFALHPLRDVMSAHLDQEILLGRGAPLIIAACQYVT